MSEEATSGTAEAAPEAGSGVPVETVDLSRRFGSHRALAGVTLAVRPGETFGLLGANGAGKTTFIRLVTGFLLPSGGRVLVDGLSPAREAQAVQARLGFVMETTRLYPELRVEGFLRFVAGLRGLSGGAVPDAVERVLGRFDLRPVARRPIGNLSKGFQQRVSLAQAFLHDPPLVIVDEPTSGLDPVQQGEVQEILRGLRGERTVLLCTHDLAEARRLATRVGVLHAGRLVAEGSAEEVLTGDTLALFRGAPAGGRAA